MKTKRFLIVTSLLAALGAVGPSACDKKGDGNSATDKKAKAAEKAIDNLSEEELFAKAYGVFPKLVAIAEKHKGNCDQIADGWRAEFLVLNAYVDKVKAIEAADPVKKKKYEDKYMPGVLKFVGKMEEVKKACKDNANLQKVLKMMK